MSMTPEERRARNAEYQRRYREANKSKISEYQRQYQRQYSETNKQERGEQKRRYYEANKGKMTELNRRWREVNKDARAEYKRQYDKANKENEAERNRRKYRRKVFANEDGSSFKAWLVSIKSPPATFASIANLTPDPGQTLAELIHELSGYAMEVCEQIANPPIIDDSPALTPSPAPDLF